MPKTSAVAGSVLQNEEGKYLLVQESQAKVHGLWGLPAGHVDEGETAQEAAIREAKEETGIYIEILGEEPIYSSEIPEGNHQVFYAFEAKITGGDLKVQPSEIMDVKWFSYIEIQEMEAKGQLRSPRIMATIKAAEHAHTRD